MTALRLMGVSESLLADVPEFAADVEALLVYGSQARGDAVDDSDLDLLALVGSHRPSDHLGGIAISYYTREQLGTGIGTLFGAHLRRDGKILWDKEGYLARTLDSMGEVDAARVLDRSLRMSELFTNPERDLPAYLPGLLRQARYLLRSCLYAQAIADGAPCFSVRELASRHSDPTMVTLLASRQAGEPNVTDYQDCLIRLRAIVGEFPPSAHGSLEATVVNLWGTSSDVLSMAFMALGRSGAESDYAEVEKILL